MLAFSSEIHGIADQFTSWKIHLIQCDAAINDYQVLASDEDFEGEWPVKWAGRGGTSFLPPFIYVEENGIAEEISCLIYLTDMYGPFPDKTPDYPVIWVATSDITAPFGETIHMPVGSF